MEALILALVGAIIIFFCLTSPKTKKTALCFSIAFVAIAFTFYRTPEDYHNKSLFDKPYKTMLAQHGETLAQAGVRLSKRTPLEQGGDMLTAIMGFTLIFAFFALDNLRGNKEDEKCARQIKLKCLALAAGVMMYLLSLYAGLQLTLIPYLKKKKHQAVQSDLTPVIE